jgi:hypothetical protein
MRKSRCGVAGVAGYTKAPHIREKGGWVEEYRLLGDGTIEETYYEGDSPEAERIREEARSGH